MARALPLLFALAHAAAPPAADAAAARAHSVSAAAARATLLRFPAPVTVAPTDVALGFSAYHWEVTATGATTVNPGASMRVLFAGALLNLTFDVSMMVSPPSQLLITVDNGAPQQVSLTEANVAVAIPANNTHGDVPFHSLEVFVKSTTERANRWAAGVPSTRVVLTGVVTDGPLAAWLPAPARVLVYGDSITEGVLTLGGSQPFDTDHNSNALCWSQRLGPLLGADVSVVGFGATGLSRGGSGGVPALGTSFNQLWDGVPRDFSPCPELIVFNEGTNDGANNITAAFVTVLDALLVACPTTPLALLVPFNGAQRANLAAAVAATAVPALTHLVDTAGFYNQSYGGALHPTGPNDVARIAPQVAAALRPILARALVDKYARA
jgi:hypothetical protein